MGDCVWGRTGAPSHVPQNCQPVPSESRLPSPAPRGPPWGSPRVLPAIFGLLERSPGLQVPSKLPAPGWGPGAGSVASARRGERGRGPWPSRKSAPSAGPSPLASWKQLRPHLHLGALCRGAGMGEGALMGTRSRVGWGRPAGGLGGSWATPGSVSSPGGGGPCSPRGRGRTQRVRGCGHLWPAVRTGTCRQPVSGPSERARPRCCCFSSAPGPRLLDVGAPPTAPTPADAAPGTCSGPSGRGKARVRHLPGRRCGVSPGGLAPGSDGEE